MANRDRQLPTNIEGSFFVDRACIDCGTCRWMAPETFDQKQGRSRVHAQPTGDIDTERALLALVACPVAAIGSDEKLGDVPARFPVDTGAANVFHCGYHSEDSYGAASYFIQRPEGNVLVDSPRFAAPLVRRLEALGGVDVLFLTHRDDVADHAKFRDHFGCDRVLHARDVRPSTKDVERVLEGDDVVDLDDELRVVPVPGHTVGSMCLLYRGEVLFTGDHLAWHLGREALYAFADACWHSWDEQIDSMSRLVAHEFLHVLPGHSAPHRFHDVGQARAALASCVEWMRLQR